MSDKTTSASGKKPSVGGEMIIPAAGILFTLYYFSTILDSPWTAQVNAFFVGSILIALSLLLIGLRVRAVMRREAVVSFTELAKPAALVPKRLALLALAIGYIFIIQWAGFTLTTFLFLACAMTVLSSGRRLGLNVLLAAVFALSGWMLFVVAFGTRFPAGPFEALMAQVM